MPRYDRIYEILARRAVRTGAIDIESFLDQAVNSGMSLDSARDALLNDLETGGPIFGKFLRSLTGAAEKSVAAAGRQGQRVSEVVADRQLRRLLRINEQEGSLLDVALDEAEPEALEEVERALGPAVLYMWVAELINTCHLCLPLHGKILTLDQWQAKGLHPDTIHSDWLSQCKCKLVPQTSDVLKRQSENLSPLKRVKISELVTDETTKEERKKSKRTQRAVSSADLQKAMAARDAAAESLDGRRTLRRLGQINK